MGSWSVYCNISKIAITAGRPCVLIPLKNNTRGVGYMRYLPATLPIFGEYDDYGGIENIEKNENTKFIEEHFNCSIEDFCTYFTRGCIRDDEEDFPKKLKKNKELKDWTFMFIDRKVYDFMSTHTTKGFGGKGDLEMGNPTIMKLIGFEYIGENDGPTNESYDPKRFKQEWHLGGKKFFSDGWALCYKQEFVHYVTNNEHGNLSDIVEIPKENLWLADKTMWQLWEHLDDKAAKAQLLYVIGKDRSSLSYDDMGDFIRRMNEKLIAEGEEPINDNELKPKSTTIEDKYVNNFRTFGNLLSDLVTLHRNLYPMSGSFEPHELYLTPQCGELEEHQVFLDEFANINRSYVIEYNEQ